MDIDGTDVRELVSPNALVVIKHDWAPDGGRIAYTSPYDYSRNPNVFAIDPDGSDPAMLTSVTGRLQAFVGTYSPNGRKIVIRVENLDRERFRIFKMRLDGSDRTLIATLPASPRFLDWVPSRPRNRGARGARLEALTLAPGWVLPDDRAGYLRGGWCSRIGVAIPIECLDLGGPLLDE